MKNGLMFFKFIFINYNIKCKIENEKQEEK